MRHTARDGRDGYQELFTDAQLLDLIEAGYESTSSRHRIIACVPYGPSAVEQLASLTHHREDSLDWAYKLGERRCADHIRRCYTPLKLYLAPDEYRRFRDLGGRTSGP